MLANICWLCFLTCVHTASYTRAIQAIELGEAYAPVQPSQSPVLDIIAASGGVIPESGQGSSNLARQVQECKNEHGQIMFMDGTSAIIDQLLPPVVHALGRLGTANRHLLVAVQSEEAFLACRAVHHSCYLDDWASSQLPHKLSKTRSGLTAFRSPLFDEVAWRRLELVRDILNLGADVLAVDFDVAYFKDPLEFVRKNSVGYDVLHATENNGRTANLGFYFVKSTPEGRDLLNSVVAANYAKPGMWDQLVFTNLMKKKCKNTYIPLGQGRSLCGWSSRGSDEQKGYIGPLAKLQMILANTREALDKGRNLVFIHMPCTPDPIHNKAVFTFAAQQVLYEYPQLLLSNRNSG